MAFLLYVLGASIILGVLLLLWRIGRSLRTHNDGRHEVVDPAAMVWSTRLHWGRPGAGIGIARRLFPRQERPSPQEQDEPSGSGSNGDGPPAQNTTTAEAKPRRRRSDWLDVLDFGDEGSLLIVGLLLTIGLALAGLVLVLLAVELILILLIAAILAVVRLLFGHPWVIEIIDPDGQSTFRSVRGLRRSVATHRGVRASIRSGVAEDPFIL